MRVAVIGAGAGGLVCARELVRAGLTPVVFEAGQRIGGTWIYEERTATHSAMYASLRTNLPTDVMAFTDVAFEAEQRFPGHADVLAYLERFAADLMPHVRLGHRVQSIRRTELGFTVDGDAFEAVAVCTGHYHRPSVLDLPGLDGFTGRVTHSHDYRRPEPYAGRRVALLGAKASGVDISGDLVGHASNVWLCGRELGDAPVRAGIEYRPPIVGADGPDLLLEDGERLHDVDELLSCIGYDYAFPFLEPSLVSVEPKWVHPLWLDMICIRAPRLAFIGLPVQVVPFPLMELQSQFFASLLTQRIAYPEPSQMLAEHEASVRALDAAGVQRRHRMRYGPRQFAYLDDLTQRLGRPALTSLRARYEATGIARRADPDGYRDALQPSAATEP